MKIYIVGISGTGLGPLALLASDAGMEVCGSDRAEGAITPELKKRGLEITIGTQDGTALREINEKGQIDWLVYTSALPADHPELQVARELGIKVSKRDELIEYLINELGLKMVAVAGTHGKTTTTSMIVWAGLKLGLPMAYSVGTTLPFTGAASYHKGDRYFVYEADEFDRNFLHFHPWLSLITVATYDHPDIYPTVEEYQKAFLQFEAQSENVVKNTTVNPALKLAGAARRYDASLALEAVKWILSDLGRAVDAAAIIEILNQFPGVGRRFEKITEGVYSDYGHHPEEIAATVEMALEEAKNQGKKGVVAIYEPHQNTRQHEVRDGYRDAFLGVKKLYWLPTYLTRENPELEVLQPAEFIENLSNAEIGEAAEVGDELAGKIRNWHDDDYLVLLMSAGPADKWLRDNFVG